MTIKRVKYFNYRHNKQRSLYACYKHWLDQHPELEVIERDNLASKQLLRVEYRKAPTLVTNA